MSELPAGWGTATVGELCTLVNGMAFKPTDWTESGRPIIRIQNLNQPTSKFNFFNGDVAERFIVAPGDLLFAWSGTPGTSFGAHIWRGAEAVLNQHIFNVRFDIERLDKQFLRFAINERLEELIGKAHGGAGLAHVTKGRFEETVLPVPPLAEQRRIVAKIEALTARSKRARMELSATRRNLRRACENVLQAAYTGHLVNTEHKFRPFSEVLSSTFYGPRFAKEAYVPDGTPTIRTTDFRPNGIDLTTTPRVQVSSDELRKWGLHDGDLLITRTGSIGKCALYEDRFGPALPSAFLIRVRLIEDVVPKFVLLMLQSPSCQRQLLDGATAVTQPNINAGIIRTLMIPAIDFEEQRVIVARIETAFAALDRVEAEARAAERALDRLDQAILVKAFRGELVPQDPADEPAPALLARIAAERNLIAPKPARGRRRAAA